MSINPSFLTLNTFTSIPKKHPKIPFSYCTQLESRSPVAALTSLRFCGFSWSWDDLSGLCTHSIVISREKIYSQISRLEKGKMGSLVNPASRHCEISAPKWLLPYGKQFVRCEIPASTKTDWEVSHCAALAWGETRALSCLVSDAPGMQSAFLPWEPLSSNRPSLKSGPCLWTKPQRDLPHPS